jgi:hypothetical protein
VLKCEGELRERAWMRVPRLAGASRVVIALSAIAAIAERDKVLDAGAVAGRSR